MDRRTFLTRLSAALSLLIVAPLATVLGGYGWSSSQRRRSTGEVWRSLGKLADLPRDVPRRVAVSFTVMDGWYEEVIERIYWARLDQAGAPLVISGRCTHLGCSVRWDRHGNDGFRCPCHGGMFDAEGRVQKGPPKEPLERPATKVEGGELMVRVA